MPEIITTNFDQVFLVNNENMVNAKILDLNLWVLLYQAQQEDLNLVFCLGEELVLSSPDLNRLVVTKPDTFKLNGFYPSNRIQINKADTNNSIDLTLSSIEQGYQVTLKYSKEGNRFILQSIVSINDTKELVFISEGYLKTKEYN